MSLNPHYMLRLAKQIQKERIQEADRFRKARRIKVEEGWWRSPIRWQKPDETSSRQRRAS